MMRSLKHRFVQYMPETLEPGVLYISLEYVTASHLCCCGCGEEIVTPFSPVSWKMTFDGETVSLWPSIGNWNLRCRSHYIIDRGCVVVAGRWSDSQVAMERERDREAKADFYNTLKDAPPVSQPPVSQLQNTEGARWWKRWWCWFIDAWS